MSKSAKSERRRPAKRGHGEGSIDQLPNGKWRGRIMLGHERRTVTGKTRQEVQRRLVELARRAEQGLLTDRERERETLATFLDRWLEAAKPTIRIRTYEQYAYIVRMHLKPALGEHAVSALRPEMVQAFYAGRLDAGLSERSVGICHAVLRRALTLAVRWGYVAFNVCSRVQPPRAPRRDVAPPTAAELARLIAASVEADDRLTALWALAVSTGMRQGELLGLRWQDIDLDRRVITVRRTLVRVKAGEPIFGEPKSTTSRRTLSIDPDTVEMLRRHATRQKAERLRAGERWADLGLVFTSEAGTPIYQRNAVRLFKAALERAGLSPAVRFHDLRHGHATIAAMATGNAKSLSARLGHSGIGITMDLYAHALEAADRELAGAVGAALRAARTAASGHTS